MRRLVLLAALLSPAGAVAAPVAVEVSVLERAVVRGAVLGADDFAVEARHPAQARGALARDRAQLENARLNVKRYAELAAEKLIAPQQLDEPEVLVVATVGHIQELAAQVVLSEELAQQIRGAHQRLVRRWSAVDLLEAVDEAGVGQPDAEAQNAYLEKHTWEQYAAWHLGLTEGANDETKARYAFVQGDFSRVHRTALIACVYRASEWRHKDVELAAHDLLQLLDRTSA